jgi:hypothetical protein
MNQLNDDRAKVNLLSAILLKLVRDSGGALGVDLSREPDGSIQIETPGQGKFWIFDAQGKAN